MNFWCVRVSCKTNEWQTAAVKWKERMGVH